VLAVALALARQPCSRAKICSSVADAADAAAVVAADGHRLLRRKSLSVPRRRHHPPCLWMTRHGAAQSSVRLWSQGTLIA